MKVCGKMLSKLGLCFPVLFTLVLYTHTVQGEIGLKCGIGVVGQPYNMECTNISATPTNAMNVFLEGETESIIFCFIPSKTCGSRNSTLYSVVSPHTTSLSFTILNVTADDLGKKLYCLDRATVDLSSQSCTIEDPTTTTDDCDGGCPGVIAGAVLGSIGGVAVIGAIVGVMWKKKVACFSKTT